MKRNNGFTVIELLIVMALFGVVATFGVIMSTSAVGHSSALGERDLLVSFLLNGARAGALANSNQVSHGIHIDAGTHTYVLFEGSAYNASAPTNRIIPFTDQNITVTNSDGNDIVFAQLSGDVPMGAGTITITKSPHTLQIGINRVGQIEW